MATTFTPTYTANAAGNALASGTTIAAGASNAATNVDFTAVVEGIVQVSNTGGGTVAATNGCQVQVFPRVGTGPVNDTTATVNLTIPTVASTLQAATIRLQPGKYNIKLTNLDATNAITVGITTDSMVLTGA